MINLLKILGFLIIAILAMLTQGFAVSTLYNWFVVPQFNVAVLQVPVAIGISVLIGLFNMNAEKMKQLQQKDMVEILSYQFGIILAPFVIIGIGWIILQFV